MAGGPVKVDRGFVLHSNELSWEATLNVSDTISLTTSKDVLAAIAAGDGPEQHLVALGYAGWSAGQLEEELAQNSWLTIQADPKVLFDTPHSDRLDAAGQLLGIDIRLLSSHAGHS